MRRAYVTRVQVKQLRDRLSEREYWVLGAIRSYRLLRVDQLQRLHFHDHSTDDAGRRVCRRVLSRLTDLGLVDRLERRVGGIRAGSSGFVYLLTPVGYRVLGESVRKRLHEPGNYFVDHTLAIAELGTRIVVAARTNHLLERVETEPEAWRFWHDGHAERGLKPDLFVQLADHQDELNWFVEVDCATESSTVIARKCRIYTDYFRSGSEQAENGVFPRVLWVVPSDHRAALIRRTIKDSAQLEPRLFVVTTGDLAVACLSDFGDEDDGT